MPPLPDAGLGLKAQHWAQAAAAPADGVWFEVHAENYLCAGGPRLRALEAIRRDKPISLHGVGLSLAADAPPDPDHMAALRRLAERIEPFVVSEHLAWSSWGGVYRPDLLPFPRTREALNRVAANVARLQDVLGRQVLIENPSLYLPLRGHDLSEADFLTALARRTGCGLLVDVNNAHVSGVNLGFDPGDYLDALPAEAIGEVHLAGHTPDAREGETLLIDSHAAPVADSVWALFARLIGRIGPRPTLIERDDDIPPFGDLMVERARAAAVLREAASPRDLERAHG